jgi:hypothetical protein
MSVHAGYNNKVTMTMVRLCSRQYCERERTLSIMTCFIYCIKAEKHRRLKLELVAGLSTCHANENRTIEQMNHRNGV